jgi:hypothetical protein
MTEYSEHPVRPLTELEVFVGNILGKTGAQSRHQRELSTNMKDKFEEEALFIVNCIIKAKSIQKAGAALEFQVCCRCDLPERSGEI